MSKMKEDAIIFNTFLERLRYNSQNYHIILFSSPNGYEYNPDTRKIRPLDSILWYDLNKEDGADIFVKYLNSYCEKQVEKFEEEYIEPDPKATTRMYNGHLAIDLDRLGKNMLLHNKTEKSEHLVDSYFRFKSYLDYLYKRNEKLLKYIIELQEDLL